MGWAERFVKQALKLYKPINTSNTNMKHVV